MLTTAERMEHMPFSGIRVVMEKATQMDARGEHVILSGGGFFSSLT